MTKSVFVDSDVVISSLISSSGAAYALIENTEVEMYISDISIKEMEEVVDRLNISQDRLQKLTQGKFKVIKIKESSEERETSFGEFTSHIGDTHIVTGAKQAKVDFLVTYNSKHFKADKIKQDFGIIVMTPANFLQYLRSIH